MAIDGVTERLDRWLPAAGVVGLLMLWWHSNPSVIHFAGYDPSFFDRLRSIVFGAVLTTILTTWHLVAVPSRWRGAWLNLLGTWAITTVWVAWLWVRGNLFGQCLNLEGLLIPLLPALAILHSYLIVVATLIHRWAPGPRLAIALTLVAALPLWLLQHPLLLLFAIQALIALAQGLIPR